MQATRPCESMIPVVLKHTGYTYVCLFMYRKLHKDTQGFPSGKRGWWSGLRKHFLFIVHPSGTVWTFHSDDELSHLISHILRKRTAQSYVITNE